jgi:hypothetical protein
VCADVKYVQQVLREVEGQFYVDNWVTSFKTEEEATNAAAKLSRALKK